MLNVQIENPTPKERKVQSDLCRMDIWGIVSASGFSDVFGLERMLDHIEASPEDRK